MSALKNPADDFATFLNGQTLSGVLLTKGTNLFVGEVRIEDVTPANAVFCYNSGGGAPEPYIGSGALSFFRPTVQVIVRSQTASLQNGEALARAIIGALHQSTVSGNYVSVFARQSAPAPLGADQAQRYLWSTNFEAQYVG